MKTEVVGDESTVVALWERQAFDHAGLRDLGLSVVFRGVPSDAGGPDYQEAILAQHGRVLITGDVEFHVNASDWERHGHHRDRRYNNVILHVVWRADGHRTVKEDGNTVPTLVLGGEAEPATQPRILPRPMALAPHPCIARLAEIETPAVLEGLRGLAVESLWMRAERLAAEALATSASQALYAAVLESMGYASNRQTFRALAEAVPYDWLMGIGQACRLPAMLHAAGFSTITPVPVPARLSPDAWRLARIRPGNHPARRIAGVAALIGRFQPSLADGIVDAALRADRPSVLRSLLVASGDEGSAIGPGRADEMVVSVILPFMAAMEPHRIEPEQLFLAYRSPPYTRWTRVMLTIFSEAGKPIAVRRAWQHQGLHTLYHRHCRYERWKGCPVCSGGAAKQNRTVETQVKSSAV